MSSEAPLLEEKTPKKRVSSKVVRDFLLGVGALSIMHQSSPAQAQEQQTIPVEQIRGEAETENPEKPSENLEDMPIPPSVLESIAEEGNTEALEEFWSGIERLQKQADRKKHEHSAAFIINPDGSHEWDDLEIVDRFINQNEAVSTQLIRTESVERHYNAASDGSKVIFLHTHPTKMFAGNNPESEHIPPSNQDIFHSIRYKIEMSSEHFQNVEHLVVTESGVWRYGFKNQELASQFDSALRSPLESLTEEITPQIELELQIFGLACAQHEDFPEAVRSDMYEIAEDPQKVLDLFSSNPTALKAFLGAVNFIEAESESSLSNLRSFMNKAIEQQKANLHSIDPDSDTRFDYPYFAGGFDPYQKRWEGVGAYMVEMEAEQ